MIPWELDINSTLFCDTKILTYEIELPPYGKKIGFNSLDDEYFTIPYITDTIPNSPAGHKFPAQDKQNIWIVNINREDSITAPYALDELNIRHTGSSPRCPLKYHSLVCIKNYLFCVGIGPISDIELICIFWIVFCLYVIFKTGISTIRSFFDTHLFSTIVIMTFDYNVFCVSVQNLK